MVSVADELVLLRGIDLVGGADGCAVEGYAEAAGLLGLGVEADDAAGGDHGLYAGGGGRGVEGEGLGVALGDGGPGAAGGDGVGVRHNVCCCLKTRIQEYENTRRYFCC